MSMKAALQLLLAAAIWGFAFVAQRVGMDHLGPYTFNGIRFALGSLSLLPLIWHFRNQPSIPLEGKRPLNSLHMGFVAGLILFIAASLQQVALLYTSAGKAAFITCLYIVLVPISGLLLGHRIAGVVWAGSLLTLTGLYFLCIQEGFAIGYGDLLALIGAFFWTAHILFIDRVSRRVSTLVLAAAQFAACSFFSLCVALWQESASLQAVLQAAIPLLYGGFGSVGIAYTLQIVGQKNAPPTHAALILSLETVFAALGGFLLLNEVLGPRELLGCALMFGGMLLAQLQSTRD